MAASGPIIAKAELFLIAIAAFCLVGAAIALIVQHADPVTTTAVGRTEEPARTPLPAEPRKFQ